MIAAGSVPNNPLESVLEKIGVEYRVIGDAKQVATAFEAVHQGYKVGLEI